MDEVREANVFTLEHTHQLPVALKFHIHTVSVQGFLPHFPTAARWPTRVWLQPKPLPEEIHDSSEHRGKPTCSGSSKSTTCIREAHAYRRGRHGAVQ